MRTEAKLLLPVLCLLLVVIAFSACGSQPTPMAAPTPTPESPSTTDFYPHGARLPEYSDFLTIKYDANSNQVWAKLYYQSKDSRNRPVALNLDRAGKVYITGISFRNTDLGVLGSINTVKYDSSGKQFWVVSYSNDLPNTSLFARAAAVDGEGNIYVTGTAAEADGKNAIIVFKYDSNGHQVWTARYQQPGSDYSDSSAITLDEYGNLYITGNFYFDNNSKSNYLTLKYENDGHLLWAVTYDGPAHNDTAYYLAADGDSNVYISGRSLQSGTFNFDYATIKYDANGKELWVARYNGAGNNYDVPHDLKLDSTGNVVVTGESDGSDGMREYATVKYNSDGQLFWISHYNAGTGSMPSSLTIDNEGNVYVTGVGSDRDGINYATIKYDGSGQELWVARYKGTGSGQASAIFVDNGGNVYVTGSCSVDSQYVTYDTIKYDPSGNEIWVAKYSKAYFINIPIALAVDACGNVYITGSVSYFNPHTQ